MKRKTKIALLAVTGVAALAVVFWMRALASWRPKVLALVPRGYKMKSISPNGQTIIFRNADGSNSLRSLNTQTGRSWDWPAPSEVLPGVATTQFLSPSLLSYSGSGQGWRTFELRQIADSSSVQTFKWSFGYDQMDCEARLIDNGQRLCIANGTTFSLWDVSTGQLIRKTELQGGFKYNSDTPRSYAISPDGKKVFCCRTNELKVWDPRTGRTLGGWKVPVKRAVWRAFAGFSPDARFVLFTFPSPLPVNNIDVLDVQSGKVLWKYTSDYALPFSDDGQQVAVPVANGCELRNAGTGAVVKRLRLPRLSDGNILRVNADWIYTQNGRSQIQRWRAR